MSKRLQVLFGEAELREIKRVAQSQKVTVAEWVRQSLRTARSTESPGDVRKKLKFIRAAVRQSHPTADIDQMIAEIERGYSKESGTT